MRLMMVVDFSILSEVDRPNETKAQNASCSTMRSNPNYWLGWLAMGQYRILKRLRAICNTLKANSWECSFCSLLEHERSEVCVGERKKRSNGDGKPLKNVSIILSTQRWPPGIGRKESMPKSVLSATDLFINSLRIPLIMVPIVYLR